MTNRPAEDLITSVSEFLTAQWDAGLVTFNAGHASGPDVESVSWGEGYSDLLNAMSLPAGDTYLGEWEVDEENAQVSGDMDVAIRITADSLQLALARYWDYLWDLIEENQTLGGRVLLGEIVDGTIGIESQNRSTGIVLATLRVTVNYE